MQTALQKGAEDILETYRHLVAYFTLLSSGCTLLQIRKAQKGEIQSLVFETHFNVLLVSSEHRHNVTGKRKNKENRKNNQRDKGENQTEGVSKATQWLALSNYKKT